MVSKYALIGIAVGVFFAGLAIGYAAFSSQNSNQTGFGSMRSQARHQIMQNMMQNPQTMNEFMDQMMQNPEQMQQFHNKMMSNTNHMKQQVMTQ